MNELTIYEELFLIVAFTFQFILICHFALRKWNFDLVFRYGWIVYAISIPAAGLSIYLVLKGVNWVFWLSGFIYLAWATYGYIVEYVKHIQWRTPPYWPILIPYLFLYLATVMFYWWPLANIYKPLWYIYGVLFLISTFLNISSHQRKELYSLKEETS